MRQYPAAAVERAMKVEEVYMQPMAKKITCYGGGTDPGCDRPDNERERNFRPWPGRLPQELRLRVCLIASERVSREGTE